jgi:hypothetical protein
MELDFKELNELVNDITILPGINELINVLYTEHLNEFLDKKNETSDDRRVLLMFLIMYFYSYLSIPKQVKDKIDVKQTLKAFLSDLIIDHTKRKACLDMYQSFESTVSLMGFKNVEIKDNKKLKEIEENK